MKTGIKELRAKYNLNQEELLKIAYDVAKVLKSNDNVFIFEE